MDTPRATSAAAPAIDGVKPPKKRGRGPDLKPRKRSTRSDNPARYLPKTADAHRIARERGKTVGRVAGSRNGWTREEQALDREMAKAKAKIEVAFWYAEGLWATGEALKVLYRAIDRDLWQRWTEMMEKREAKRETIA
jgi:hypothetical protein